jgi:DNA uptake protein ComE-like DNA-binding protein
MADPLREAADQADLRLHDRAQARQLAARNPALAKEMGVGRPDVDGASAAGLVDINNGSAAALTTLPGVDDDLATRIVETRAEIGGFSSVEDLGTALDLDGDLVERLRDHVVFLPR